MNMRKTAMIAVTMLMLLVFVRMNDDVSGFLSALKYDNPKVASAGFSYSEPEKKKILVLISEEAEKRKVEPINASFDRIWKAIPGYNGLEVDVEKTLAATLRSPTRDINYVYKEVEPKITLDDVGPHEIFRGNPNKKMISFMVNVAWGNEYIESILKTLENEHVKATFFLDGSWLKKYPDVARQIQSAGHEMSNHAYSHPDMKQLGRQAAYDQIAKTEALLKSTLNVDNKWFAPPSGSYNEATVRIAAEQGLKTVLWTIDTVDWMKPSADSIVRKISSKLEPGALILMHPTASSRDALAGMIKSAKAKGYVIGTVSETLSTARVPDVVEGANLF